MQVFQDLKGNRFIQAWAAFGQAGWKLEGECEPDVSFGFGKLDILGDNWLSVVTFEDGEQFTWNKVWPMHASELLMAGQRLSGQAGVEMQNLRPSRCSCQAASMSQHQHYNQPGILSGADHSPTPAHLGASCPVLTLRYS